MTFSEDNVQPFFLFLGARTTRTKMNRTPFPSLSSLLSLSSFFYNSGSAMMPLPEYVSNKLR